MARHASSQFAGAPGSKGTGACAWCGRALDEGGARLAGRVRCASCGVATTYPSPTAAQLETAYGGWYRPQSGRFAGFGDALLRFTRGLLARRLDRIAPAGPVLDVGAGEGALLDALARRGRRAVGIEREAARPDLTDRTLAQIGGQWAGVVFWHSLEHLPTPGEDLDRAAAMLAPSGVLVIAMPNADSLQARAFGDRWLALDLPRHLVHVPASALLQRLRSLGFSVERVSFWRGGQVAFGWLHGLVAALPGHPDLYDAIRRPDARRRPLSRGRRATTLISATLLAPLAGLAAAIEVVARRGGTIYVECRNV